MGEASFTTKPIEEPPLGDSVEPRPRSIRDFVLAPVAEGLDQRELDAVLDIGKTVRAVATNKRRYELAVFSPKKGWVQVFQRVNL